MRQFADRGHGHHVLALDTFCGLQVCVARWFDGEVKYEEINVFAVVVSLGRRFIGLNAKRDEYYGNQQFEIMISLKNNPLLALCQDRIAIHSL